MVTANSQINVAHTVPCTEAEGPGRRFAVWVQGCPLRCPGCCNPEMLPFRGGRLVQASELLADLKKAHAASPVEGVTLLGGEPFAQAESAAEFCREVQACGLSVMVFSGYRLDELRAMKQPAVGELLGVTDILVDGPYLRGFPDTSRRWIGSTNQQIHFLSNRYRADDPCWQQPDTLEIRLGGSEISVNGFPAAKFRPLWQRTASK